MFQLLRSRGTRQVLGVKWKADGFLAAERPAHDPARVQSLRYIASTSPWHEEPYRKTLKDERKRLQQLKREGSFEKSEAEKKRQTEEVQRRWQVTIGLEIHAQLNTERKLFSDAAVLQSQDALPNTQIAPFDLAIPGTQPIFQKASLVPAIRAALAFGCNVQRESRFDRKHYFYQDQPNGYQITQYYHPYARDGHLSLTSSDGLTTQSPTHIRIKQIQMEQDTAKSTTSSDSLSLLDFNRVGTPLIEIITEPDLHSAAEAAACVKKIQSVLQAVNAVTSGMEIGGLRCDVNVSVAPRGRETLGQRVEIKNLNTLQSIVAAIEAETERQVEMLESGRNVVGETRAWSLKEGGSRSLRGKEGVVDYRYMPDADIPVLRISEDLVKHLQSTLPPLPEETLASLTAAGLTLKDARTLLTLEDGARLDYFDEVCEAWASLSSMAQDIEKSVANWLLHEIGSLLSSSDPPTPFAADLISAVDLAKLLHAWQTERVTRPAAKRILVQLFKREDDKPIEELIAASETKGLGDDEYTKLATDVMIANEKAVKEIKAKGKQGKLMFLVGQMMRASGGNGMNPQQAEAKLRDLLGLPAKS